MEVYGQFRVSGPGQRCIALTILVGMCVLAGAATVHGSLDHDSGLTCAICVHTHAPLTIGVVAPTGETPLVERLEAPEPPVAQRFDLLSHHSRAPPTLLP